MSFVFVLDAMRNPLAPVHPGRARYLLRAGHAAVWRRYPFTLILTDVQEGRPREPSQPLRLKLDPGSKTTGLAVVNDTTGQVVFAAEITHRGQQVKDRLAQRRSVRRPAALGIPATAPRALRTDVARQCGCPRRWKVGWPTS